MPRGSAPANSPPDSFSTTRRQLGGNTPAGPDSRIRPFRSCGTHGSPRAGRAGRPGAAGLWPGRWRPGLGLADLEPGEAGDRDAVLRQDLVDRGLLVLHERLLGEHDVLEV